MKTMPLILAGLISSSIMVLAKPPVAGGGAKADYVAHEWGTFTCVQGADGLQLEWNPFVAPELPKFVYDVRNPLGKAQKLVLPAYRVAGKTGTASRQRMETPVIYFYSKEARTVDVDVDFPGGRITEWYPQLANPKAQAMPIPATEEGRIVKGVTVFSPIETRGSMRWGGVDILPGDGSAEAAKFPKDETGSHYYAARETEASALRVKTLDGAEQYEKFLFYRGIAEFEAPLQVTSWGEQAEQVRINNRGEEPIGPYFIYAVRGDRAAMVEVPVLGSKVMEDKDFKFEQIARPAAEVRAQLAEKLRVTLTKAGLYEKEASAMVKTWEDSWLGEQGMRVLYPLPQKWCDQILPLTFTPAPKELKRVFVGRAEVITPAQEWALLKEVTHFAEGGTLEKKAAVAAASNLGLGRFADAALRHVSQTGPRVREFYQAVSGLQEGMRPVVGRPPVTGETAGISTSNVQR